MSEEFKETLSTINAQQSELTSGEEKAVEWIVILPLLKQLGWRTEYMKEVYPQHLLPSGGRPDFCLRINGESQILIEVKRWAHLLNDEDENQLRGYCREAKPKLAVLTNGKEWRLFLPATERPKDAKLRRFLDFDITTEEPEDIEENFRQFLAKERLSVEQAGRRVVREARSWYIDVVAGAAVMQALADAWNELVTDKEALCDFVEAFAKYKEIQHTPDQVKKFVNLKGPSVNKVLELPVKPSKPVSFTFRAGREVHNEPVKKQWNIVLNRVCLLMHQRHHNDFGKTVLEEMPQWFSMSSNAFDWSMEIGDTGIFMQRGGGDYVKQVCREVVAKFGYPEESLTIEEK